MKKAPVKVIARRSSPIREAILLCIQKSKQPLSVPLLVALLAKKNITPNKTTLYRELDFLVTEKMVRQLQFQDEAKYYELMPKDHHHHIVCLDCKKIDHVELKKDLQVQEKRITKDLQFNIISHSLEFYGFCVKCQANNK